MLFRKKKPKDAPADAEGETQAEVQAESAAADAEEGAEGEAPPKKKGKKLILMLAAAAVVVTGAGGAGAFFLLGGEKGEAHGEKGGKGDHAKGKKKKKKDGGGHGKSAGNAAGGAILSEGPDGVVYYTLPDLVVNIQSPDGRPTYLKLKLTLELPDAETAEALSPAAPRLNDMFTTFLRELRPEDLSGSQGTYQLRQEILRRVNLVAAPAEVNAVLIEEMLIQG
jgi:flagellar FliL protein